jgi:hypothetical protein
MDDRRERVTRSPNEAENLKCKLNPVFLKTKKDNNR